MYVVPAADTIPPRCWCHTVRIVPEGVWGVNSSQARHDSQFDPATTLGAEIASQSGLPFPSVSTKRQLMPSARVSLLIWIE